MNQTQMTMQIIVEFKNLMTKATDMKKTKKCWKNRALYEIRDHMIDRNEFNRCRAETACENVRFEWFDFRWISWFEIADDTSLTKDERRHFFMYDIHALSEWFFCEHRK